MFITRDTKRIALVIIVLCLIFVGYKYMIFKKNLNYINELYDDHHVEFMSDNILLYIYEFYVITGELPTEESIEKKLYTEDEYEKTNLFLNGNYTLEIDTLKSYIKLYSHGYSKKDNKLKNRLNIYPLSKRDKRVEAFSFFNFLLKGDYDLVFIDGSFDYNCIDLVSFETKYIKDDTFGNDKEIHFKLDSLLNQVNLKSGFKKDFSNSIVYIYNGTQLKKVCPEKSLGLDEEKKEELLELINLNFSDYDYIKFSVMPN